MGLDYTVPGSSGGQLVDISTADHTFSKITKALELTRANLEEARRSVMDLRAAPLQERTLPAALQDLVGSFSREQGVRADFGARDVGGRLSAAIEAGLYRIAQEALNNIARHADATTVHVTLEREAPAERIGTASSERVPAVAGTSR